VNEHEIHIYQTSANGQWGISWDLYEKFYGGSGGADCKIKALDKYFMHDIIPLQPLYP
jgi:hypothetical protein